jgi:hypothetical protein
MASIKYVIPLVTLDRAVLDMIGTILPSLDVELAPVQTQPYDVFQLWIWKHRVAENLLELDGDSLEDHGGDRHAVYDEILNSLRRSDNTALAANTFRVNAMEEVNVSFLNELGEASAQEIECVSSLDDSPYWRILQSIHSCHLLKLCKAPILQNTQTFDIWDSMKMLLIKSPILESAPGLYPILFEHPVFKTLYEFRRTSPLQEENTLSVALDSPSADQEHGYAGSISDARAKEQSWQMFHRKDHKQKEMVSYPCQIRKEGLIAYLQWPDEKSKFGADGKITNDYLVYMSCFRLSSC